MHYRGARRRSGKARNWKPILIKDNFLNLVKEIDVQVQEAQRVPNKMDTMRPTPIHVIIKLPKVKYKDRILKAAREKQRVTYKGVPIRLSADFSKKRCQLEGTGKTYSSDEKQGHTT